MEKKINIRFNGFEVMIEQISMVAGGVHAPLLQAFGLWPMVLGLGDITPLDGRKFNPLSDC